LKWIHRLFNPHCTHCIEERECGTCKTLQAQLDFVQTQNKVLLERLMPTSIGEIPSELKIPEPINKLPVPWHVKRRILEEQDRHEAQLLKDKQVELKNAKSIPELEKALKVEDNDATKIEETEEVHASD